MPRRAGPTADRPAGLGAGRSRGAGHRRGRSAFRRHDQSARGHGRRGGDGTAGRGGHGRLEFVQFHPTALHHPAMPRPLLSEALRGHGAILRDARGRRFVDELAPRDVVSRAMASTMAEQGVDHLWLDATGLERFGSRFPTIAASLQAIGLDPAKDWLPIAPAAHHLSGGVVTDLWGASRCPDCGRRARWRAVACTGPIGWPRTPCSKAWSLAPDWPSRSPLVATGPEASGVMRSVLGCNDEDVIGGTSVEGTSLDGVVEGGRPGPGSSDLDIAKGRETLQLAMTAGAGVVRTKASLHRARAALEQVAESLALGTADRPSAEAGELANLLTVGRAVLSSAEQRQESRGAHTRADFPDYIRHRLIQ